MCRFRDIDLGIELVSAYTRGVRKTTRYAICAVSEGAERALRANTMGSPTRLGGISTVNRIFASASRSRAASTYKDERQPRSFGHAKAPSPSPSCPPTPYPLRRPSHHDNSCSKCFLADAFCHTRAAYRNFDSACAPLTTAFLQPLQIFWLSS